MTGGPLVYVLAERPSLSQTFVLGELLELLDQGEDVHVLVLRDGPPAAHEHPRSGELEARTTVVPAGAGSGLRLLGALVGQLVAHPRRTTRALARAGRWSWRQRRPNELVRLAQVALLARRLPAGCRHLHAHFAHGPASAAMLLSTLTGVPFSFTGHARDLFELSSRSMLREKATAAAFVVAISEHGRRHLLDVTAGTPARVVLVRNGIDLPVFAAPPGSTPPLDRAPRLLAVSRLVPKKGLDVLVAGCAELRRRGLDVPCELVGDGPLAGALRDQAARLGVADLVLLRGALTAPEVVDCYRRASVFVLPCRVDEAGDQDGLPVSIVEAMAAGLPVVSTPVAGVPEVVLHGTSGLLVGPDDPLAVAGAVQELLADQHLRRSLSAGARQVAAGYDRVRWVGELRQHFAAADAVSAGTGTTSTPPRATALLHSDG